MVALAALLLAASAQATPAVAISPLNGTPDASPESQISFLGVPASEINDVYVVGSESGVHAGRLEPYVSAPGASFVPTHPFTQGERVSAIALVGTPGHAERMSTTFTIARLSGYRPSFGAPRELKRAGLEQSFLTVPELHPPVLFVTTDSPQTSAGDLFLTPSGGYGQPGAMIVNGQGDLVWFQPATGEDETLDLQVQTYRGQPVLTWWQGRVSGELGVGFGTDEIYNSSYQPVASVSAGNGYQADLHEFQLTPQGSAFVTAYSLVNANLASLGGSPNGIIQDAILQEIDVPTGLVMFEWHAYGHVPLSDSYMPPLRSGKPWDYFHLNSVSEDPSGDGNFIVSARNTWAAYEINHITGSVMWSIGGRDPSFKMGSGTGFAWQHDVQWQPDETLTIYDDGATPKAHAESRAIRERIDTQTRSVELIGRYVHTPPLLSGSQGNYEVLGDGDGLVGWGEAPYLTEFNASGQTLFDAHLPAPGDSYRAYRFLWSGTPTGPPVAAASASSASSATVYASWNGATNVSQWRVFAGQSPSALYPVLTAALAGFETAIPVASADTYFAVQALGAQGQVLGTSQAVER